MVTMNTKRAHYTTEELRSRGYTYDTVHMAWISPEDRAKQLVNHSTEEES